MDAEKQSLLLPSDDFGPQSLDAKIQEMKVRAAELKEQARHENRKARFHIYGLLFFAGVFWLYHRFHSGMNEPCDKGYDHTIFTYTEKAVSITLGHYLAC